MTHIPTCIKAQKRVLWREKKAVLFRHFVLHHQKLVGLLTCGLMPWLTPPSRRGTCKRTRTNTRGLNVAEDLKTAFRRAGSIYIYCMPPTGPHTATTSFSMCVPKHAARPACKTERTDFCFVRFVRWVES